MFKRCLTLIVASIALMVCVGLLQSYAADNPKAQRLEKTTTNAVYRWFTINNIFNWYNNNGRGSYNKITSNSGFEYPKGGGIQCIFEDGVVWGGFSKGVLKVGGSTYNQGLQAGAIRTPGGPSESERAVAYDPLDAKYRVYRVRPDVNPNTPFATVQAKLEAEATLISRYESFSAQTLYNLYIQDWNEWPGFGSTAEPNGAAPFLDKNGNGRYDPTVDVPGQPGADQTLYYVANDLNAANVAGLSGSLPIGLEMHRTVWGYNLTGALGSTIFESSLIINKSGAPVDSCFFVQWSDPDDGVAEDDYAGCDVGRSVGYVYNGKPIDGKYGVATPAAGYDFFQGPILPTGNPADRAVFRLQYRNGYKNMGMTTFVFFINSNATYADPNLGANGDIQWYRLMNGHISSSDAEFINPLTNQATKFTLDGDPVTGQGWLDGTHGLVPGDRRLCLVTGPFTLANGDTQELVVGKVAGQGADRISSVNVMKWYDDLAQGAYDNLFTIPRPPPTPIVTIDSLDQQIVLSWSDSAGGVKIESFVDGGYAFEGYNIYQFKSSVASLGNAVRLATYDKVDAITTIFDNVYDAGTGYVISKPVQFGGDAGIKRYFKTATSTDGISTTPLVNGTPYYFGVSSYSFNGSPTAKPTQLESAPNLLTIVPQWSRIGQRISVSYGDTVTNIVHVGPSDGVVFPVIVNPMSTKKEGATYKIVFFGSVPNQTWSVVRTWNGRVDTVLRGQTDQDGTDTSPIVDGIQWRVIGAPLSFKRFYTVSNGAGPITPFQEGCFAFNSSGFPTTDGLDPDGVNDRPDGTKQQSGGVLTASKGWGIHTGMNDPAMSLGYTNFLSRVSQSGARWPLIIPYDWEIRFTAAGGKALFPADFAGDHDAIVDVPFELWNIGIATPNNTADDYRLMPNILDVDGNYKFNLLTKAGTDTVDNGGGGPTHSISGGANDPFTDWIYWAQPADKSPGQAGYNACVAGAQADIAAGNDPYLGTGTDGIDVIRRMVFVGWNMGPVGTGAYSQQMPQAGTTFRILTTKPNQGGVDNFTITVPPYAISADLAKTDVDRVNVFPNPYIGYSTLEADKYNRFVQFSHLPTNATIRIFNLAGILVKTLQKTGGDQLFKWNLRNEQGFPVASGMYIVYIDMPDQGKTKTLKLGVVMEQQFIDRW